MRLAVKHTHLCGLIIKEDLSLDHRMPGVCIFIPKKLTNGCSTKRAELTMDLENNVQTRLVIFPSSGNPGMGQTQRWISYLFCNSNNKECDFF